MELNLVKQELKEIRKMVINQININNNNLVDLINDLRNDLNLILSDTINLFKNQARMNELNLSVLRSEVRNEKVININFFVTDNQRNEHKEWHLINGGRRAYTPIFVSFPLYENYDRTFPNSLRVIKVRTKYIYNEFGGRRYFYLNNRNRVKKHQIAEIKPRYWYLAAFKQLKKKESYKKLMDIKKEHKKISINFFINNYPTTMYKKVN